MVVFVKQQPHWLEWETVSWIYHYLAKCRPGPWMTSTEDHTTCNPRLHQKAYRTKQSLAVYTIVAKVPAWIRYWAAELLKKQITSTYWNSVEPGFGSLSAPHNCLDPRNSENSTRMSSLHNTHLFTTFVDSWKDSTHWDANTSIFTHDLAHNSEAATFCGHKSHSLI